MTFSVQSRHSLTYVIEENFGDTPVSPSLARLRHTGCEIALAKKTIQSDEIRDDRQMGHVIHSLQSVTGDVDFELSFGSHDDILAAALYGDWNSDVLKSGTIQKSLTFERGFNDISQFQTFTGCVVDELNLSIQPESLVAGRFSVIGKGMETAASPSDASPSELSNTAPIDSFMGTVSEGGSVLAHVAGIDLKIENGAESTFVLGSDKANSIVPGRSRVSGELVAYFENNALIEKFINADESSLEISLSGIGGSYAILIPKILYTGADMPVKGDKVVTITLPFAGLYDESAGTNLKITRTAT